MQQQDGFSKEESALTRDLKTLRDSIRDWPQDGENTWMRCDLGASCVKCFTRGYSVQPEDDKQGRKTPRG